MATISPTQSGVQTALRTFLLGILPAGTEVVEATQNRVPEPSAGGFVVMTPIRIMRLRTNVDSAADCRFTGTIAASVLTAAFGVSDFGTIAAGALIFGTGVAASTAILNQLTGPPGGAGTYTVSVSQTVGPVLMSTGQRFLEEGAEVVVQLDFHTADLSASDLAQTVSTSLRDAYGTEQFAGTGVTPLYADDPRFMPFINENQQSEWRWVLEAHFQINQTVALPKQYADAVAVDLIDVDAAFPP